MQDAIINQPRMCLLCILDWNWNACVNTARGGLLFVHRAFCPKCQCWFRVDNPSDDNNMQCIFDAMKTPWARNIRKTTSTNGCEDRAYTVYIHNIDILIIIHNFIYISVYIYKHTYYVLCLYIYMWVHIYTYYTVHKWTAK